MQLFAALIEEFAFIENEQVTCRAMLHRRAAQPRQAFAFKQATVIELEYSFVSSDRALIVARAFKQQAQHRVRLRRSRVERDRLATRQHRRRHIAAFG
jgi:hypothetical protein